MTPKRLPSLSVVLPAYNDGGSIPSVVAASILAARQTSDTFEVIVTDDGSRDQTGQVLDELAARHPELRVIHHPVNRGYGAALRSGFGLASKEWVFYTDGDAQYNPLELSLLVDALDEGVDVVNGYKISRSDSFIRKIAGRLYHHFAALAFSIKIRDVDCDFRLIRRRLLQETELESEDGTICLEMIRKFQVAGARFAEVPVHHYPRLHGTSQFFTWPHLAQTLRQFIHLFWKFVILKQYRSGKT
jgi:glycosyltransferase involved in cell wall biosynthesis